MKKKILFSSLFLGISIITIGTSLVSCSSKDSNNGNEDTINPTPNPDIPAKVEPIESIKQLFNAQNIDSISNLPYTNDFFTIDQINSKATQFINDNDLKVDKIIIKWAENYLNNFIISRGNLCIGEILENTINVKSKNTISGNIKFQFRWTKDMNHSSYSSSRAINDVEIQNFIFDNVKIEPYINNGLASYLSFYLQPTRIEKKLTTTVQYQNSYDLSFNGMYKIYLDKFINFKVQLNNYIFSLDLEKYINNINSYRIANNEEKEFIKEVFSKIVNSDAQFLLFGQNPINTNKEINEPILKINLSKNYNLSSNFLKNFVCDLNVLLSFVQEKSDSKIDGTTLYINCKKALNTFINPNNANVIDLTTNQPYANTYRDHRFLFDSYRETIDVKNKLIENNQSKITNKNWLEYLKSLTDEQKAKNIYDFSLPFVSYGAKDSEVSETSGYINGKVLCDGYAKIFAYIGSLLQIPTISIVGNVYDGAVPGQTGTGGLHAWNLIKVNNEWLWCDPTWDDSQNPTSSTYSETYFLKTTPEFFTPNTHLSINNWDAGDSLPISLKKF